MTVEPEHPKTPPLVVAVNEPAGGTPNAISDRAQFVAAANVLASANGPVAIDTERASGYTYSTVPSLVQVKRGSSPIFLFDTPALGDLTPLQRAIGGAEWIFHSSSQDLASLREVGLAPAALFDTELASRLLGLEHVGLGAVVESLLGVRLAKDHAASNWSKRPLPQSWLTYAALDVEYLIPLRDKLIGLLDSDGKREIAREEFDAALRSRPKPPDPEPWRRLKGLGKLRTGRQYAIARSLWQTRDSLARRLDSAPGRLLPDTSIIAASAAKRLASKHQLASLTEFTGRTSRSKLDLWWQAVLDGQAVPAAELPKQRLLAGEDLPMRAWRERNFPAWQRLNVLRADLAAQAAALSMPHENLLAPALVRAVCWNTDPHPSSADIDRELARLGARRWQRDFTVGVMVAGLVDAQRVSTE